MIRRREFLKASLGAAAGVAAVGCAATAGKPSGMLSQLQPMTSGIEPITDDERWSRIEKAQRLMASSQIDAVYLDAGTSLLYFTGVSWWPSERMFAAILPARGEPVYVCPAFEEGKAREMVRLGSDVRTWEEDESPSRLVAQALGDLGIRAGRIGMEERVRFFLFDGIRAAAPDLEYVSADSVTIGCRVIKSPAEIALMQRAADITIAAYKAVIPLLTEGMTAAELNELTRQAHKALGAEGSISAQIGEASAFPHGSSKRPMREGDVVLMDGGCRVEGYRSDISRTVVLGPPNERQRNAWHLAKQAQAAAFEAASLGTPIEGVDWAARRVYVGAGLPGGYSLPGCPHRTGHGIGMDGHECIHVVRGNTRRLEPGMCFSNEPMLVYPGEFGIRLEDCFFMTLEGPRYFSQPSPSIEQPCA